jgi:acyl dehydratase
MRWLSFSLPNEIEFLRFTAMTLQHANALPIANVVTRGRYFEDFKPGDHFHSPGVTVTESMIIEFALVYDPQPFHLDLDAAAASHFGGLIASGIQTLALGFRAFLQLGLLSACGMGSPGLDELRWLHPVRPGDTLRSEVEVVDARPSRSKADRGMLIMAFKIRNQHDENVLTTRMMQMVLRRPG